MATQSVQRRKSSDQQPIRYVKCSVSLDAATNARLAACAALEGIDKSTYMSRCITESLKGFIVIDRRKVDDQVDPSSHKGSANGDEAV